MKKNRTTTGPNSPLSRIPSRLTLNRETIHILTLTDRETKQAVAGCFCWSSHTDCRLGSCGICGG